MKLMTEYLFQQPLKTILYSCVKSLKKNSNVLSKLLSHNFFVNQKVCCNLNYNYLMNDSVQSHSMITKNVSINLNLCVQRMRY
jgi:hypothetical protein